ncbi:LysR family transcriptional regulator [Paenibacillus sp. EPM92]|uniref:LysR family transcriptional regulator n=1 Tax=Paenibacillus sp. EPM92 TaxID=1561195 RepID=UPI0019166F8D|nr:LysR family transcriptional regulator [Paenibacillus sp. EPM92]
MNIDHLQTFLTICDCKNFSEAAKMLYVPQPTISNRIRYMEDFLGHELFVRGKKGVQITLAGEALLPYAKQILDTFGEAVNKLNKPLDKQELIIGSSIPFTFPLILDKIQDLYSFTPETSQSLIRIYSTDMINSLLRKEIDMAFVNKPIKHRDVETHHIGTEALHLVLSKHHPMITQSISSLPSITNHEFIVYYQPYYELFRDHPLMSLEYKRKFVTNHAGLIKQLIIRMNAISFLPLSLVEGELEREELTFIPLKEAPYTLSIPYFLIYRQNERYFEEILLKQHENQEKKFQNMLEQLDCYPGNQKRGPYSM